jgi:hypothetical protein
VPECGNNPGVPGQGELLSGELLFPEVEANPKGYNFPVHVTTGHEHEAMETQRRKKPSRVGRLVLKMLGFKGEVGPDYVE